MPPIKSSAVVIAMLVSLPLVALHAATPARADGEAFTLPPFRIGDTATYNDSVDGPLTVSIGEPTRVLDASIHERDVIPVLYEPWGMTEYFSPNTMTLEAAYWDCLAARNPDGTCKRPIVGWEWYSQGSPAVMGATYLQGRTFQIGDSWLLPGDCSECSWRRVTIESPNANSPDGTAFVANIRGDYMETAYKGRIHMSTSAPFPLLVEWASRGASSRLASITQGTTPILSPTPPDGPAYLPSPLPILPFEDGRPVEGMPIPGWRSWSDARNASQSPEAGGEPNARFASVSYPSPTRTYIDIPTPNILVLTDYVVEARFALPGAEDRLTKYRATTATVAGEETPYLQQGRTETLLTPTNLSLCPEQSVPIWDSARLAMSLPYLHDFRQISLAAPRTPACLGEVAIMGDSWFPPGGGFGFPETLHFTAQTGRLRYADTIVEQG